MPPQRIGTHCLIELSGCTGGAIDDAGACEAALRSASVAGGLEVLQVAMHRFEPQGVTGLALLAESHLAVHTWPEHGYVAADLFTCGNPDAVPAVLEVLRTAFGAGSVEHHTVERVGEIGQAARGQDRPRE